MEKTFTFNEMADQLGITLDEFLKFAKDEGLIDETGRPTKFAIENGLLIEKVNPEYSTMN